MVEPLDRICDRIKGHQFFVESIFHSRSKSTNADDRTNIEQGTSHRGHAKTSGSHEQVDLIDPATAMNDHAVQLGTHPMRYEHMDSWIRHSAQTPLLSRGCERQCRRWIPEARRDLQLITTHGPGCRSVHPRQHSDELAARHHAVLRLPRTPGIQELPQVDNSLLGCEQDIEFFAKCSHKNGVCGYPNSHVVLGISAPKNDRCAIPMEGGGG